MVFSFIVFTKRISNACCPSKIFYGSIENDLCMGSHPHGARIAYSWISPHSVKAGLILGVVVNGTKCPNTIHNIGFPLSDLILAQNTQITQ